MGFLPDVAAELRGIAERDIRRRQADAVASRFTAQTAAAVGRIARWHPWIPSGVAIALADAGHDADSEATEQVSQQIVQNQASSPMGFAQPGDTISPRSVSDQQLASSQQRFDELFSTRPGSRNSVARYKTGLEEQAQSGGIFGDAARQILADPQAFEQGYAQSLQPHPSGWLNQAQQVGSQVIEQGTPGGQVKTAFDAAVGEARGGVGPTWLRDNPVTDTAQRVIDSGPASAAYEATKATTRTATAAMDFPRQYAQAQYRTAMANIREHGFAGAARRSVWQDNVTLNPGASAQAGAQSDIIQTEISLLTGHGLGQGQGFFVGADSPVGQSRRALEAQYGTYANGQVRTIGRDFADAFFEPGTQGFNVLSGLGDAVVAVATDQLTTNQLQDYRKASRAFEAQIATTEATTTGGRVLENALGLVRGSRYSYSPVMADAWLDGAEGRRVIERLADTSSVSAIDAMTGRKVRDVGLLAQLADAQDPASVRQILRENLGLTIRQAPTSHLGGRVGQLGLTVRDALPKPLRRWSSAMPAQSYLDLDDARASTTFVQDMLTNTHADRTLIDDYTRRMVDAPDRLSRFGVLKSMYEDIASRLAASQGVDETAAKRMTRMFTDQLDARTQYATDEIGNDIRAFGILQDGTVTAGPSPTLLSEHLSREVPVPDVRDLRRQFSHPLVKAILDNPIVDLPLSTMMDIQTRIWKPFTLARPAYVVRIGMDEQARLAATGRASMFGWDLPQYIALTIGDQGRIGRLLERWGAEGRASTDVFGDVWSEVDEFAATMNRESGGWIDDAHFAGWDQFKRGEDGYAQAAVSELGRLAEDPASRMVAAVYSGKAPVYDAIEAGAANGAEVVAGQRALTAGNPLLDAQQTMWDNFDAYRRQVQGAHPEDQLDITTREGSDFYTSRIAKRVNVKTQGIPELVEAARTGRINGVPIFTPGTPFVNPEAVKAIEPYLDQLPDVMVGPVAIRTRASQRAGFRQANRFVDATMSTLASKPTNKLARSKLFRDVYIERLVTLSPVLDRGQVDDLLDAAKSLNLSAEDIKALRATAGTAVTEKPWTFKQLDAIAKGHAIDDTKDLLYDLANRNQFFDVFRAIIPFGDAWGEQIKVWGNIFREQPKTLLTVKRILEGGRSETVGSLTGAPEGQGFFYRNEFGDEVFAYPGSAQLMQQLGGVPVPLTGRLQGLTMGTEVIPGVGPIAQIPLAALLPDTPAWDGVARILFPFGRPKDAGDPVSAFEDMLPAWARTVVRGWKQGGISAEGQRAYANTTMDVMRYLVSTGDYKVAGSPDSAREVTRLVEDAKSKASWLTVIRGAAQSSAPSSPTYEWYITDKNGQKLPMLTLVADYRQMQEDDYESATQKFLAKYGDNAFLLMQGKSVSVSSGILPPTTEANDWLRTNGWAQKAYPSTYGFFAPQGGEFSSQAYQRQLELQERVPLTPEQFVRAGNDMIASSIYYSERDAMMQQAIAAGRKSLAPEQQAYMRDLDEYLRTQYEGYGDQAGKLGRAEPTEMIDELTRAVKDPKFADTKVAKSIAEYLGERDWVREQSKANLDSENSYQSAAGGATYRQHLEAYAESIIADDPDFAIVWERVFRSEIREGLQKDTEGEEQ